MKSNYNLAPILLSNRCNRRCTYCLNPSRQFELSNETAKQVIEKYAEIGKNELRIAGGEPTLRHDLLELICFAKTVGFKKVSIVTNAILLRKSLCTELKEAGLDRALVSMPYHSEELAEHICGSKHCFLPSVEGVKNLIEENIPVGINLVIIRQNYELLYDIVGFFMNQFEKLSGICLIWLLIKGRAQRNLDIVVTLSEAAPYLRKAMEYLVDHSIKFKIRDIPPCIVGEKFKQHILFNHVQTDVYDITFSKPQQCIKCAFNCSCMGLTVEYCKLFGTNEVEPIMTSKR